MIGGRNATAESLVAIASPVAIPKPTAVRQLGAESHRMNA